VSVSEKSCPDDKLTKGLINNPAPGDPISPATVGGTPNVAQAFGVNNPILSYLTNDLVTGNPLIVNVTTGSQFQGFSPGYVALAKVQVNSLFWGKSFVYQAPTWIPYFPSTRRH
jgi:hypothetical protein